MGKRKKVLHWPRLELGSPAWQASILPLDHQCLLFYYFSFILSENENEIKLVVVISIYFKSISTHLLVIN